jgi:hypothetical protein
MRSLVVGFALAVSLLICGAAGTMAAQDGPNPLRVEEDKTGFRLLPHSGLEIAIFNSSSKQLSGKFSLELLGYEDDSVATSKSGTFTEQPGETIEKIDWSVGDLPSDAPSLLGWYRLRYTFELDADSKSMDARQLGKLQSEE